MENYSATVGENYPASDIDDIQKTVDAYLFNNTMPPGLGHPSNTCDPYSGYWEEHLMNPYDLKKILKKDGFQVKVLSGIYCGNPARIHKRCIQYALNATIQFFKNDSLMLSIAPFYIIFASITEATLRP